MVGNFQFLVSDLSSMLDLFVNYPEEFFITPPVVEVYKRLSRSIKDKCEVINLSLCYFP